VIPVRPIFAALIAIAFTTLGMQSSAFADTCPAEGFVKRAGQAYDRAASAGSAAAFAHAAGQFSDLRQLSLFALGQYRKDLPKAREAEYLRLTRNFIGNTLKKHGGGLGGNLDVVDCASSGGGLVVTARSAAGRKIVFRLAKAGGGYTVNDVNMQGIWLAQQMRSKFTGTVSRSGIDGLFAYLGG